MVNVVKLVRLEDLHQIVARARISWFGKTTEYKSGRNIAHIQRLESPSSMIA
jgi:hypothetical protein